MKKFFKFILPVSILFFSCNFEIPTSLSVKTSADYSFSLGDVDKDFTDNFDKTKLETSDLKVNTTSNSHNSGTEFSLADYYPSGDDGKIQKYLLRFKVADFTYDTSAFSGLSGYVDENNPITLSSSEINDASFNFEVDQMFKEVINGVGTSLGIDSLYTKVDLSTVPIYLYFDSSNLKNVSGKIYMYSDSSKTAPTLDDEYVVGKTDSTAEIKLVSAPSITKDDTLVTKNIDSFSYTAKKSMQLEKGKKLFIGYSNFSATITNVSQNLSMAIYAYMVLPFSFEITESSGLTIDVLTLSGKGISSTATDEEKDLFNRSRETSTSDIQKYVDVITNASISYKTTKQPFYSENNQVLKIKMEDTKDSTPINTTTIFMEGETQYDSNGDGNVNYVTKDLSISGDSCTIEGISLLFETYPLRPDITLTIPAGYCSIPRQVGFTMNLKLNFSTNGTIEIF